jgi:hypothetical protein
MIVITLPEIHIFLFPLNFDSGSLNNRVANKNRNHGDNPKSLPVEVPRII